MGKKRSFEETEFQNQRSMRENLSKSENIIFKNDSVIGVRGMVDDCKDEG